MARGNWATARARLSPRAYFQRAFAAFLAISFRRLADMPSARAFPPLRPSATAAGSLPSSSGGGTSSVVAGRDPHDVGGVADHVGGGGHAFGDSGHIFCAFVHL